MAHIEFDTTMKSFAHDVASATEYLLTGACERFENRKALCKKVFWLVQFDVTDDRREFLEWVVVQTANTLGFSY